MNFTFTRSLLCGLVFLFVSANSFALELISNGSFETPDIPSNSITSLLPAVPGWNGVAFIIDGEAAGLWPKAGSQGQQYADVGNNPSTVASQAVTVPAGHFLDQLNFDANGSTNAAVSEFRVEIWNDTGSSLLFGSDLTTSTSDTSWMPFSLDLSSTALGPGDYELRWFGTTGISSNDTLIDNVSLSAVAVPEPTAAAMLFTLFSAMLTVRTRMQQN